MISPKRRLGPSARAEPYGARLPSASTLASARHTGRSAAEGVRLRSHFRPRSATSHVAVEVAVPVDLRRAKGPDVDPVALKPVRDISGTRTRRGSRTKSLQA